VIIEFLVNPNPNEERNNSLIKKIKELFLVLIFFFLFISIVGFFEAFIEIFVEKYHNISIRELIIADDYNFTKDEFSLFILLLFPFLEEIAFRFSLVLKKNYIIISLIGFSLLFLFNSKIILFTLILLCFILYIFRNKWENNLIKFLYSNYKIYYYTSALIFSGLHITNFINIIPKELYYLSPIYVLPQFIFGLFAGYIRIKNGFIFAIIFHFIFNLPFIIKNYL